MYPCTNSHGLGTFSLSDESIHVVWLAIRNRIYNHANILNALGLPLQGSSGAQSKSALGFESWALNLAVRVLR